MPTETIDIVFDGPPAHESGRFVDTCDLNGEPIGVGEWVDRENDLWALRIVTASGQFVDVVCDGPPALESGRFVETEDLTGRSIRAGEWIAPDIGRYWSLRIDVDQTTIRRATPPLDQPAVCRHCSRGIEYDHEAKLWVDPEAAGDDSIWRETCGDHDTMAAEHEPEFITDPPPPLGIPYGPNGLDEHGYYVRCPVCDHRCRASDMTDEDTITKSAALAYAEHYTREHT